MHLFPALSPALVQRVHPKNRIIYELLHEVLCGSGEVSFDVMLQLDTLLITSNYLIASSRSPILFYSCQCTPSSPGQLLRTWPAQEIKEVIISVSVGTVYRSSNVQGMDNNCLVNSKARNARHFLQPLARREHYSVDGNPVWDLTH